MYCNIEQNSFSLLFFFQVIHYQNSILKWNSERNSEVMKYSWDINGYVSEILRCFINYLMHQQI